MEKIVSRTIAGIALVIVGFAVLAVFSWNVFALNLPVWSNIPATIIGIPLPILGILLIVNTFRKKS